MTAHVNPVLPGFHPDPSVCTVDGWTYLVTSTFEYLPGLPVHRSRDLVHWELVGHALPHLPELAGVPDSGGMYAPTIRHDGTRFLVVCTLVDGPAGLGHLIVTATDPAGPWSEPVWLEGPGIDPSVLVDDDPADTARPADPANPADTARPADPADPANPADPATPASPRRAWFCATRLVEHPEHPEQTEVWLRELDLDSLRLVGEEHVLWRGALRGAVWAEGPHLYRTDEGYLLLAAEGGTERHHAVCVATAPHPTGPWTGHPGNPVLTHRHLGHGFPVQDVGHADLLQAPDGTWWAVALATRPLDGCDLLGRETFLTPVTWEDGVPVLAPGVGHLVADPPGLPAVRRATTGDHGPEQLTAGHGWLSVRTPPAAGPDGTVAATADAPAWLLRRLEAYDTDVAVELDARDGSGLVLRYSDDAWLALTVDDGAVVVRRCAGGTTSDLVRAPLAADAPLAGDTPLTLRAAVRTPAVTLRAEVGEDTVLELETDVRHLCPRSAGGFVGTTWGVRVEPAATARVRRATWQL